jgi:glycosyltransferase involved in cell wall biosynthesis
MSPLVSVVIPAYNAKRFIGETLESVLNQTYRNLEVLVVDDGSNDGQEQIIAEFVQRDKRVRHIYQENAGVSAARNKGFKASKGNFIAFLDADDVWLPVNVETKVKRLQRADVGLVHSDAIVIDEDSTDTAMVLRGAEGNILDALLLWDGTQIPGPSSVLVARDILEAVGLFDEALSTSADMDLFIRIASHCRVARVDAVTWKYRMHANNMHKNISLMEKDVLSLYEKTRSSKLFKNKKFEYKCFAAMYLVLAGTWRGDGRNFKRGLVFALKAVRKHPPVIMTVIRKVMKRRMKKNSFEVGL